MSQNRLRLDWSLETKEERNAFAHTYLSERFLDPTEAELDTIAKYILWGKSTETGLNGRQEGLELETRSKIWDAPDNFKSLEELIESPNFSEQIFKRPEDPIYKLPKLKFDRKTARETAPPETLLLLEDLWRQIDTTELLCAQYDQLHNKRKSPIRNSLLSRFTPAELEMSATKAASLSTYLYLKKRHELVELRRQQYTLRDSYAPPILSSPTWNTFDAPDLLWGEDIELRPLGLILDPTLRSKLLRAGHYPSPSDFTKSELYQLVNLLISWEKPTAARVFDFSDVGSITTFATLYLDLDSFCREHSNETLELLFSYWDLYVSLANLKDFQLRLLSLKLDRHTNAEIRDVLRTEFNKNYTLNYISTLYHQTILPAIATAATRYYTVISNLPEASNFKTCIDCGRAFLKTPDFFVRKGKVADGFSPRCKQCEKLLRERRKSKEQTLWLNQPAVKKGENI